MDLGARFTSNRKFFIRFFVNRTSMVIYTIYPPFVKEAWKCGIPSRDSVTNFYLYV